MMLSKFAPPPLLTKACGRRFRLWLLLSWFVLPQFVLAQEPPCFPADECGDLRLLIVRDSAYIPPGCPSFSPDYQACANLDLFYQLSYRVYLRYAVDGNTADSLLTFNLDHNRLNARVRLQSNSGYSFIENKTSKSCFLAGFGAAWDTDSVVVWDNSTFNEIAVDFQNETLNDCGDPHGQIRFSPDMPLNAPPCPSGKKCVYAPLFPVVAYACPGDTVRLECAGLDYLSSNDVHCSPTPQCAVNTNNGFNGIYDYAVPLPAAPAQNGYNENLLIRLTDPVNSASVNAAYDLDVEIVNTGDENITVYYLDFMAQVDIGVAIPDLQFASATFDPPVEIKKVDQGGGAYTYYALYSLPIPDGLVLEPDEPVSLSTMTVGPPMPLNQSWESSIRLIHSERARVESTTECSRLHLSGDTLHINSVGDDPCGAALPDDVYFTIRGRVDTSGACTSPKIQVGFYTTQNSDLQLIFEQFKCQILFDWSGNLSITGVDFGDEWKCAGNCLQDCYDVDHNNEKLIRIEICDISNIVLANGNNYEAFFEIEFEGPGCINNADLQLLRYIPNGAQSYCVPVYDNSNEGIPVCGRQVNGHIVTEADAPIADVKVRLDTYTNSANCNPNTCPRDSTYTNSAGEYLLCPCAGCDSFALTPYKNNDPLNGVSTFDLVLINKHILGTETLNSPYKIIAADANNSRSITTFDIVELRKLILGIYTTLPNNTSWRFIPEDYTFPNPLNPFQFVLPDSSTVPPSTRDFIGIKVGDVNGNAEGSKPAEALPLTTVGWPALSAKAGKTVTVPVLYTGDEPLEALQLGLRFDPSVLELLGPSAGDLPATSAGNFGLTKVPDGEIRWLWLPDGSEPDEYALPGATLFYLSFRLRARMPESGLPLHLDDAVLANLAWRTDDRAYGLRSAPLPQSRGRATLTAPGSLHAECRPNPTAGGIAFAVTAPQAGSGRIALFDAFGKLIFMRKVDLLEGKQEFLAPEVAPLPAGVYVWRVYAGGEKISGHFVKQ